MYFSNEHILNKKLNKKKKYKKINEFNNSNFRNQNSQF